MLLDAREPDEYAAGHIPGSVNLPLSAISAASKRVPKAAMTAEKVSLMRSERGKNGMIYTEIGTVFQSLYKQ